MRNTKRIGIVLMLALCISFALVQMAWADNSDWAAVYYAPHPDDDTIGMAQSIVKHRAAGRPVYVVLYTDGEASGSLGTWLSDGIAGSPSADLDGDGDEDVNDFALARRNEFKAAMAALGVPAGNLSFRGRANPNGPSLLADGGSGSLWRFSDGGISSRYQDVKDVMSWYEGQYTVGGHRPSHKTVMRYFDSTYRIGDSENHLDHWYVSEGLDYKCDTYGYDGRFYKVKIYSKPVADRYAPHKELGTSAQHAVKQDALDCYRIGRPSCWTGAYSDLYEYMTLPSEF